MAKFCPNCGAQLDDAAKFCAGCGTQTAAAETPPAPPSAAYAPPQQQPYAAQPYPQQQAYPPPPPAKKKSRKGLIIALVIVAVFFVGIPVAIFFGAAGAIGNEDYYALDNDKIPSVKLALGEERKVSGVSINTSVTSGARTKTYKYNEPGRDQSTEMSRYLAFLREKDGFQLLTDVDFDMPEAQCKLGRNSVDSWYKIIVQIEYDRSGYAVTIVKEPGEITPNGSDDPDPYDDPYSQPNNYQPPATQAFTPTTGDNTAFSADDDYYIFGGDRVPSVKQVLGYRSVSSSGRFTMSGAVNLQAEYKSDTPNQDAYEYLIYLKENDGFASLASVDFSDPSGQAKFGRNSVDSGYMIVLTLDFDSVGYKLDVQYLVGEVTMND